MTTCRGLPTLIFALLFGLLGAPGPGAAQPAAPGAAPSNAELVDAFMRLIVGEGGLARLDADIGVIRFRGPRVTVAYRGEPAENFNAGAALGTQLGLLSSLTGLTL